MGVLCVTEFRGLAKEINRGDRSPMDVPETPPLAEQRLDVGPEVKSSAPFSSGTYLVMVKSVDARCAIAFGKDADPQFHVIDDGERLFYGVQPHTTISVIEAE